MQLQSLRAPALFAVLLLASCLRVASTHRVFTQTSDEHFHVAAGMEWLDKGTYTYELLHPPLTRIVAALGPYLLGRRSTQFPSYHYEGNSILHGTLANGTPGPQPVDHQRVLSAARLGNLLFFALAATLVFAWLHRWGSPTAALLGSFLFLNLPPILGHAGLATMDIGATAFLLAAVYTFTRWLEAPTKRKAFLLGLTIGLCIATKFSLLLFLPVALLTVALAWLPNRKATTLPTLPHFLSMAALLAAGATLALWAAYHFDPRFLSLIRTGLAQARAYTSSGHSTVFNGELLTHGNWLFFPLLLILKTPLTFLALAIGSTTLILVRIRRVAFPALAAALIPASILLVSLPLTINIGLRHVLVIFPFLAIAAASLWNLIQLRPARILLVLLTLGMALEVGTEHPDYLAYFNALAGDHPEAVAADSDLDWGQDLQRLAQRSRELGITQLNLMYNGSAPLATFGLPSVTRPDPFRPVPGWTAISARLRETACLEQQQFCWLKSYEPVERIGKSIFLYEIPSSPFLR